MWSAAGSTLWDQETDRPVDDQLGTLPYAARLRIPVLRAGRPQVFVRSLVPGSAAAIGSAPALNQTAGMDAPSAPTVARPIMLHEHPPWPLARARALDLTEDLIEAAGLPAPRGRPLVHHSAGVPVRIGAWKPVRT